VWIVPIFGIFTKSPVPVRRVAWFSVSCWIAYLLEPQLCRNFRILGVTDFFWLFVAPKKDLTPIEDLLLRGPFVGPVPADPSSSLFFCPSFFHLHRSQQRPQRQQDRRAANPAGRRRTTQEAQVRSFPNIISRLQEQSLHFARVGYLLLSRPQQFFGREIMSLLSLYRLSVAYFVLCVCVIWNSNFFDNTICKSDAGNCRVAF
jgi:hypothetical protein